MSSGGVAFPLPASGTGMFLSTGYTNTYNLDVVNARVAPNGFARSAVTIDGKYPGTTIKGNRGDSFRITVNNKLTDPNLDRSTALHWHGLLQYGTAYADGPSGATQCPIGPAASFTYEFHAAHQAGTFWYHSHVRSQYTDGAKGAFIIYDPQDPIKNHAPYDIDNDDTILQLSDWFHAPSPGLLRRYFSDDNAGSSKEPPIDGGLINGFGRCAVDCPKNTPYYTNTVQTGKAYRMRVIN
ncbi:hypothetical protein HK097_000685, partial [Rhizophlyctis rosea]